MHLLFSALEEGSVVGVNGVDSVTGPPAAPHRTISLVGRTGTTLACVGLALQHRYCGTRITRSTPTRDPLDLLARFVSRWREHHPAQTEFQFACGSSSSLKIFRAPSQA